MSKWHKFHSQYSPINVATINQQTNAIHEDWNRLSAHHSTVNGVSLVRKFTNKEELQTYFKEVILKDFKGNKNEAAAFLINSFHQGGLLNPVSACITDLCKNEKGQALFLPASDPSKVTKHVDVITTENGFKVQEFYKVKTFTVPPPPLNGKDDVPTLLRAVADEDDVIVPDEGKDYVIKAGAMVDVDFTQNAKNPTITIESNYISYGNSAVQAQFDTRHFGQILLDFLKVIFGLNAVKNFSSNQESNEEREEIQRISPM
ncbi:hypothetical protein [Legionella cardiaca]|uniref:Uncharacterized protein n=1 Tax=Legionella cardiaca TaxID=1071983 RepID=A0ABY8AUD2_9GAMM|nr:hypothetical protein [Legionella cardiaca]WED44098.1 hypothetical protein PXX05_04740 [Legionella cardiaca]